MKKKIKNCLKSLFRILNCLPTIYLKFVKAVAFTFFMPWLILVHISGPRNDKLTVLYLFFIGLYSMPFAI